MRYSFFQSTKQAMKNFWKAEVYHPNPSYWSEPNPPKITVGQFIKTYAITSAPFVMVFAAMKYMEPKVDEETHTAANKY